MTRRVLLFQWTGLFAVSEMALFQEVLLNEKETRRNSSKIRKVKEIIRKYDARSENVYLALGRCCARVKRKSPGKRHRSIIWIRVLFKFFVQYYHLSLSDVR